MPAFTSPSTAAVSVDTCRKPAEHLLESLMSRPMITMNRHVYKVAQCEQNRFWLKSSPFTFLLVTTNLGRVS